MDIGSAKCVTVYAKQFRNFTGLKVLKGQIYQFELIRVIRPWKDAFLPSPLFGIRKKWMYWFFKPRIRDANYFALCGGVGDNDDHLFTVFHSAHEVEVGNQINIPEDGDLFLFANDAQSFYFNNHGEVKIKITRIN